MVLHHISDDAVLIEVPTPALCAKRLLEADLHHKLAIRHCPCKSRFAETLVLISLPHKSDVTAIKDSWMSMNSGTQ